jgi:gentisate 1,2-dioxygenase
LLAFRWDKAREALDRLAEVESDPFDDVMLEYVQPRTGAPVFPCIAAYLQMVRPGVETKAHRHSSSAVYFVREGSGTTEINGTSYVWSKGDVLVVPPSAVHRHKNSGREPAVLFTVQDSPMLKKLGFYREEAV